MSTANPSSELLSDSELSASVQVLPLSEGVYFISVRSASPVALAEAGDLVLPAVYIGPAPSPGQSDVEVMSGPNTMGHWLCASGDSLVIKVPAGSVNMVIVSLRAQGGEALAIDVERLENRGGEEDTRQAVSVSDEALAKRAEQEFAGSGLPVQVLAHIRNRGDVNFADRSWAGRLGRGFWIEAFSVTPLEDISAADIEYKGVTASGIESPWITNGASCGTRGLGIPLVGFACRLKPEASTRYECEYSGYFQSGAIVGPLRDGQPCRSAVPNEPLEGIRIRITDRKTGRAAPEAVFAAAAGSGQAAVPAARVSPRAKNQKQNQKPSKPGRTKAGAQKKS